ncbi:thiamine phosphate synthase [Henriciella sp. AS95]|uniref:thiamine phosphate synthase n=1 Tax=Henriciella sp. AS95 TaxID=3135782 RepID=UPI0031824E61
MIIRHFGRSDEIDRSSAVVEKCRLDSRACLIGADPDLALHLDADGVHWPARLAKSARQSAHLFALNTMSAHSRLELRLASDIGMDAALVSTVFASASPSATTPLGLPRFANISRNSRLPIYALGGIDHSNAERVSRFGGFASVSGFQDLLPRNGD